MIKNKIIFKFFLMISIFLCKIWCSPAIQNCKKYKNWFLGFQKIIQFKLMHLFKSIIIETTAYCNRKCEYCPNNPKYPQRKKGIMDFEKYKKIVNELSSFCYVGRISPHMYGETLLDKRIFKIVKYTREKCPFSEIMLFSNGDFLTKDVLIKLVDAGMDSIYVSCYDKKNTNLEKLSKDFPDRIDFRYFDTVKKSNKGGLLENVEKIYDNSRPCYRPSEQFVVNWKGEALMCCNDYYGKYSIGNTDNKKIYQIWYGDLCKNYQKVLSCFGGRKQFNLCKYCNG